MEELHGFEDEAKQLYGTTKQAMPADSWAILKLAFLGNYVDMYTSIVKSRIGRMYYLETNAGCGLNKIEDVDNAIVFGSPMVAMKKARKAFDGYVLVEKEKSYCEALQKLMPSAHIINGDVNSDINNPGGHGLRHALSLVPRNTPILAFVDPYGMDVRWRTLELLLDAWSDVIINFQSVQRVVGSVDYNVKYASTLTDFFGTNAWQQCRTNGEFLELYMSQIRQHKDVVIPIKIQGRGGYYYHLIVAVKKTRGPQDWIEFIHRTKDSVERADANDVEKFMNVFAKKQGTLDDLFKGSS
ncbi:three-Cys-motif partner protein TcmP [Nitrososphaera viennensis]|uniref:Three-Cys-motif partner protein TcmP n=1 Tax=Nitrososphaera viennensis TaxID=1034015 RepID=A0A977IFG3_9ARCH|nr:three-Cys-motif partner protein TcmP [Nitrososphaera viennensis]UVS70066.1 three-Cys-motif partner protein TcmP [Nitrososphaera viennensis]